MAEFWKDYGKLCKETGKFYKKHWRGLIVMNVAAILGAELAYFGRHQIKDKIEKIRKEKENES